MSAGVRSFETSSDLLSRVCMRDTAAWEKLADLYGPLVYYWCRRSNLQGSDAADIFQNVFAAVANNIHSYQPQDGASFRGWLWVITRNKIHDHFRQLNRQGQASGGTAAQQRFAELPDYSPNDDADQHDQHEFSALLHRGLEVVKAEFAEKTWQAFWRSAVDGDTTANIAADLNITPAGVRQAKSRVLRRLRIELDELS